MDTATTIRVSRQTRDVLASHAKTCGVSLNALLTAFAADIERDRLLADYREATAAAVQDDAYLAELRVWEAADGDGVV